MPTVPRATPARCRERWGLGNLEGGLSLSEERTERGHGPATERNSGHPEWLGRAEQDQFRARLGARRAGQRVLSTLYGAAEDVHVLRRPTEGFMDGHTHVAPCHEHARPATGGRASAAAVAPIPSTTPTRAVRRKRRSHQSPGTVRCLQLGEGLQLAIAGSVSSWSSLADGSAPYAPPTRRRRAAPPGGGRMSDMPPEDETRDADDRVTAELQRAEYILRSMLFRQQRSDAALRTGPAADRARAMGRGDAPPRHGGP
jgi:hypothetical protein